MIRAGLGVSTLLDPKKAAEEASGLAIDRLGSEPSVSIVVATAAHGRGVAEVAGRAGEVLGSSEMVGGSVEGIVAPDVEVTAYPAVLVLAVAGVDAQPFLLRDVAGEEDRVGEDLVARLGCPLEADDVVVVLPDSLGVNASRLVGGLAEHLAPATVLGTGAAATRRGPTFLWNGPTTANEGVSGVVVRGARPRLGIAQAGRCVTALLNVTRARGNWVLGLEGRPALETYLEIASERSGASWDEAAPPLLVGVARNGGDALQVRNVVGFDRARGAFSVPEPMRSGDRLALVELDAAAARQAFADQLCGLRDPAPALGLYFNCRARGASLFGEAGVEATLLANAFANCPIAGIIGAYQIAPFEPGGEPLVLTYAGALALFD